MYSTNLFKPNLFSRIPLTYFTLRCWKHELGNATIFGPLAVFCIFGMLCSWRFLISLPWSCTLQLMAKQRLIWKPDLAPNFSIISDYFELSMKRGLPSSQTIKISTESSYDHHRLSSIGGHNLQCHCRDCHVQRIFGWLNVATLSQEFPNREAEW